MKRLIALVCCLALLCAALTVGAEEEIIRYVPAEQPLPFLDRSDS